MTAFSPLFSQLLQESPDIIPLPKAMFRGDTQPVGGYTAQALPELQPSPTQPSQQRMNLMPTPPHPHLLARVQIPAAVASPHVKRIAFLFKANCNSV